MLEIATDHYTGIKALLGSISLPAHSQATAIRIYLSFAVNVGENDIVAAGFA